MPAGTNKNNTYSQIHAPTIKKWEIICHFNHTLWTILTVKFRFSHMSHFGMFTWPLLPMTRKEAFSLALFTYMSLWKLWSILKTLARKCKCVPFVLMHYMSLSILLMVTLSLATENVGFYIKCPIFLFSFNQMRIFFTDFHKSPQYQVS